MTVTVNGTTGVSLVQDSTITSAKIVDGTISGADLSGGAGSALTITTNQTTPLPAASQLLTYTHGLGITPLSAEVEIVCLTAELGYSVGDVVTPYTQSNASYCTPFTIRKTSTVVEARTGGSAPWAVNNHTTGNNSTALTSANWAWRFKIRAA